MSETQNLSPFFAPPLPLFTRPVRSRWREYGRPALLFVVTAVSICVTGSILFESADQKPAWGAGLVLFAAAASIMVAHEMGHYVACRYYGVDASLPHFLPVPPIIYGLAPPLLVSLIGTFGAFIRIRGPIPNRKALFDIGVAGPLAGFVVTVVVLVLSLATATYTPIEPVVGAGGGLNNPPLFTLASHLIPISEPPAGMTILANQPLLLAAWFGALLTALNLMPVGQLDGGHAIYALLTRYALRISRTAMWLALALVALSPSWLLWYILLRVLLGRPHPPTLDDIAPVGTARAVIGILTLVVFLLCFMPQPMDVGWPEMIALLRAKLSGVSLT